MEQHGVYSALAVLAASVLSSGILLGNCMVIVAVAREKKLQKLGNSFLVNLAIADGLAGVITVPLYTLYMIRGSWGAGWLVCDLWLTLDGIRSTASCLSILTISIDRYWSVAHPFNYRCKMTRNVVMAMITPAWLVPVFIYGVSILGVQQLFPRGVVASTGTCMVHYYDNPLFVLPITLIHYWGVLVPMVVLYVKIHRVTKFFWNKREHRRAQSALSSCREPRKLSSSRDVCASSNQSFQVEENDSKSNLDTSQDFTVTSTENPTRTTRISHSEEYLSSRMSTPLFARRGQRPSLISPCPENKALDIFPDGYQPRKLSNIRDADGEASSASLAAGTMESRKFSVTLDVPLAARALRRHSSACPGDIPKDIQIAPAAPPSPRLNDARMMVKRMSHAVLKIPLQLVSASEQRTSMRILTAILGSFVVCWTPYTVVVTVQSVAPAMVSPRTLYLVTGLSYLNALINPIVYTCATELFRDTFKRMLSLNLGRLSLVPTGGHKSSVV